MTQGSFSQETRLRPGGRAGRCRLHSGLSHYAADRDHRLLAQWAAAGVMPARFVTMDSEHSMLTAAGVAAATGARVFTATSSQAFCMASRCSTPSPGGACPWCW